MGYKLKLKVGLITASIILLLIGTYIMIIPQDIDCDLLFGCYPEFQPLAIGLFLFAIQFIICVCTMYYLENKKAEDTT